VAVRFVYVPVKDRKEALSLARAVVSEKLAGCGNIIDHTTSVYHWDGAMREDAESLLILKTRIELVQPLMERVRELHSYRCPCIAVLEVSLINADYERWLQESMLRP
jgi:periplasmic divalent cation tolerance protein